jgi:hypothetical protein
VTAHRGNKCPLPQARAHGKTLKATRLSRSSEALPWFANMRVRDFTVRASDDQMTRVIAQELLTTHPETVHMTANGFYAVDAPNP